MKIIVDKQSSILEVEERLKTNSLAYKLSIDPKVKKPKLIEGSNTVIGLKAINEYIDNFESEKQQWHYCDC